MGFIGNFFRKRRLKKYASKTETGFIPLSSAKDVTVILDAEDRSFQKCRRDVEKFFAGYGIRTRFIYADFRKFTRDIRPVTDAAETVFRRDSWIFGLPKMKKVRPMIAGKTDILISFPTDRRFILEFIIKSIDARFKIGRVQLEGEPFDMTVVSEEDQTAQRTKDAAQAEKIPQDKVFNTIRDFLPKIK